MPYDPVRGWYKTDAAGTVITGPGGDFLPGYNAQGNQYDAKKLLRDELDAIGLGALVDQVWGLKVSGAPQTQIDSWMQETPEYKQRFAGMAIRKKNGYTDIDVGTYIRLEDAYRTNSRQYGLPEGLYDDPSDFATYIGNNMSGDEHLKRVADAYRWALDADPYEKAQMRALYGLSDGDFAAMALDPDRALPFLEQRKTATQIAGQAARTGWGQLTQEEAQQLQTIGVDKQAAGEGFANLETFKPLFYEGFNEAGGDITKEQQLGAQFGGDVAQQQRLSRRQRQRKASFATGGGAAMTGQGVTGLGSTTT